MPAPTWKGYLKLSLISLPVRAYTATDSGEEIHLNQLHAECHNRIRYKKTCPIHGEVNQDEIASGYEFAKGEYVVVDPDELDKLRTEDEKAISIQVFIQPDALDPIYQTGKTYYLIPDGPIAQRPYAVLRDGMREQERHAVAQVVLHGREHVVLLRPMGGVLAMTVLAYHDQIKPSMTFRDDVPKVEAPDELKMTKMLIDASTENKFDLGRFKDTYLEKMTQLIETKVADKEIVAPPPAEQPHVINLMDALRQSVAEAQKADEEQEKPPKKVAASKRKEPAARKRRSG